MNEWISIKELCEKYPALVYENVRSAVARQKKKGNKALSKKKGNRILVDETSFIDSLLAGTISFSSLSRNDLESIYQRITNAEVTQDIVGGIQDAFADEVLEGEIPYLPKRKGRRKLWTFISLIFGGMIAGFLKKYWL